MISTQEQPENVPLTAALYVGDLNPDVTENTLFKHFGGETVVTSTKVCRDMTTKRSLGYAYVNFRSMDDAKNAIEQLNYTIIIDRPCRIMWSSHDPVKRKDNRGNLYIKNIDKSVDARTIYQAFVEFGEILSFKIVTDDFGNSKGYGFIHFATDAEAKVVMEKVNGLNFKGRNLVVCPFVPRSERGATNKSGEFNNLFVKNFVKDYTEESLLSKFSQHGNVTSSFIPKDDEGNLKGFAFICFENADQAAKAVEALHNLPLKDGVTLYVRRGMKKNERAQELLRMKEDRRRERYAECKNSNLYVKNLPESATEETLTELFSKFGTITSCRIMRDTNGVSRKFGFVCFENQEQANNALSMSNTIVENRAIYVAIAQSKDERRYQLAYRFSQMKLSSNVSQVRMVPNQPPFAGFPPGAMPPPGADMRQFRQLPPERAAAMMRGNTSNAMFIPQFAGPQGYMQAANPRHMPPAYMGGSVAPNGAPQHMQSYSSRGRQNNRGGANAAYQGRGAPPGYQGGPEQMAAYQQQRNAGPYANPVPPRVSMPPTSNMYSQVAAQQAALLADFENDPIKDLPTVEECTHNGGRFELPADIKNKIGVKLLNYARSVCGEHANFVVGAILSRPAVLQIVNNAELIQRTVASSYESYLRSQEKKEVDNK